MKKQELIHLHGLLAEVSNQCAEWDNCQIDLDEYESLGIRPTSIHKSKTDHKAAVFALAGGITMNMREGEQEAVAATAD
ncbi:hypothetical protein C483_02610 [Natrialba hulunbeirensis JCM 10989]|uniref:Metal-binding protein n=1 Tax=Natrialba hulunbeirensis JCM 10989 TaxID=1227493 RepID=M0A9L6_9EURY|nr:MULTISPECIES: UPF0058 family protein [Natrialba]ELY94587.1 hypothetical protein C483_02610 [Natrialba hulunbeirensis JCM 10989]OIB56719.1 metal-binding protein [Natrialba sp. SSL1]